MEKTFKDTVKYATGITLYMKSCKDSLQGNISIICFTLCFPLGLFYVPKQFVSVQRTFQIRHFCAMH